MRLHRIDENHSSEVAPLLAYLRDLQRACSLAVVLVHHAKKGGGRGRAGQELRGSSELHAWGDSNLYLRRRKERLVLSAEHRAAPSHGGWQLELNASALCLELVEEQPEPNQDDTLPESPVERVCRALADADQALTSAELRSRCRIRTQSLGHILRQLLEHGLVVRSRSGYQLTNPPSGASLP